MSIKVQSTARKFKLITGRDLMAQMKRIEKETKDEGNNMTEEMEFAQYGLHLAYYEVDLSKAKRDFSDFLETGMMEQGIEPLEKLSTKWSKELKG